MSTKKETSMLTFHLTRENIELIIKVAKAQKKNLSDALNILLDKMRRDIEKER